MEINTPITLDQLTTLIDKRAELKANALISKALGGGQVLAYGFIKITYTDNVINDIQILNSYNILRLEEVSLLTDSNITFKCHFTNTLSNSNYIPLISAEAGGRGTEIYGVYVKTARYFTFDFTTLASARPEITEINIFVFGK